jgi:hypothetical protein
MAFNATDADKVFKARKEAEDRRKQKHWEAFCEKMESTLREIRELRPQVEETIKAHCFEKVYGDVDRFWWKIGHFSGWPCRELVMCDDGELYIWYSHIDEYFNYKNLELNKQNFTRRDINNKELHDHWKEVDYWKKIDRMLAEAEQVLRMTARFIECYRPKKQPIFKKLFLRERK